MHLFDIDIPGKITFKESLTLTPGEGLTVVDTEASRGDRGFTNAKKLQTQEHRASLWGRSMHQYQQPLQG